MDFQYWFRWVLQPQAALEKTEAPSDLFSAFKVWAVTGLWAGLASGLFGILAGGFSGLSVAVLFFSLLIGPLVYPLVYAVLEGIYFLSARALGGKGSFRDQFYFVGLTARPILPVLALLSGINPLLSFLASMLVGLYWLYPKTVVYRHVHGFDWFKAILVWLIPSIVLTVLGLFLLILFFGLIAAAGAGAVAVNATR